MAKLDLELFVTKVQSKLQSALNTQLSAIDTEKSDGITLKQIPSSAYFIQELNGSTVNYNPFILLSVDDIQSEGHGPFTSDDVTLSVILVLADQGEDVAIASRMFRYQRAIKEVFEDNFSEIESGIKLRVSSLVPVALSRLNTSQMYRAIGVSIRVKLAC